MKSGFTLVEVLIGTAIFLVVVAGVFGAYRALFGSVSASRERLAAADLISEKFEHLRSLPYSEVVGGSELAERAERSFELTVSVEEGVEKLVEVALACELCRNFEGIRVVGIFVPQDE